MNVHKNARLTFEGRRLLVERIAALGLMPAAEAAGISPRTARKWRKRFEENVEAGLLDRSSPPANTHTSLDPMPCQRIEQLRRSRMPMRRTATVVGRSVATVGRLLGRLGLSSLKALDPVAPAVRYERQAAGELLHIDTKKLGRIVRPSHRVTGDRRDSVDGAGWEFAHVAIDDHSRVSVVQMHANERKDSAVGFLLAAVAHYEALGVKIKRLITDNGSAYRSCQDLPGTGHQTHVHQALPTADQWQGRALHPDVPARMGQWPRLGQQRRAHRMAASLPELLQRPKAALGTGLQAAGSSPLREQVIATQQLGVRMRHIGYCVVRRADRADVEAITAIILKRANRLTVGQFLFGEEGVGQIVARWVVDPSKQVFVAQCQSGVVGFIAAELGSHALEEKARVVKLRYVFTATDAPRWTVASLVRLAADECHSMGADLMASFFGGDRPHAFRRLLVKLGFSLTGTQCLKRTTLTHQRARWAIEVRPATNSDLGEIRRLAQMFYTESNRVAMLNVDAASLSAAAAHAITDPNGHALVACSSGELVGFVAGRPRRVRGTGMRILKNSYWYVSPAARGTFAARALLLSFESHALDLAVDTVVISTSAGIHTVRTEKFLQHLGYEHVGDNFVGSTSPN